MPRLATRPVTSLLVLLVVTIGTAVRFPTVLAAREPPVAAKPSHQRVPGGVPEWTGESFDLATPPRGFSAAVAWMQAVQDTRRGGESWVEVDWLRLHEVVDARDRLIADDEYDRRAACGGLYVRDPWFAENRQTDMHSDFKDGKLLLRPSERPRSVYHWWNCRRAIVSPRASRVWAEARIRIHGGAAVQLGIDYWRDADAQYGGYNVNNREAGSSRWYFDESADWQVISVGRP